VIGGAAVKKSILSAVVVLLAAAAAHAQGIIVDPPPREKKLIGHGPRCGYYGWGGYGVGGYGFGGTGTIFWGYGCTTGDGPLIYGVGSLYGGTGYYGGYGIRSGYWSRPSASADAAGPLPRTGPVSDRLAEFASAREIEDGRARLRAGDYRGAVDSFRAAVAAQPENPLAQAWFAVGLATVGDGKNADKALRSAAGAGFAVDRLTLADGFRDEKERVRVIVALARSSGDGTLASAFALSLTGEGAMLKKLAEKDSVAKSLLPK
jgi:hypothetical protein